MPFLPLPLNFAETVFHWDTRRDTLWHHIRYFNIAIYPLCYVVTWFIIWCSVCMGVMSWGWYVPIPGIPLPSFGLYNSGNQILMTFKRRLLQFATANSYIHSNWIACVIGRCSSETSGTKVTHILKFIIPYAVVRWLSFNGDRRLNSVPLPYFTNLL
jgi:hypothetical protein